MDDRLFQGLSFIAPSHRRARSDIEIETHRHPVDVSQFPPPSFVAPGLRGTRSSQPVRKPTATGTWSITVSVLVLEILCLDKMDRLDSSAQPAQDELATPTVRTQMEEYAAWAPENNIAASTTMNDVATTADAEDTVDPAVATTVL
ncbi:hypothetical protein PT974_10572 [Cladobotryum mycophilum]|uniref:Uncharacterized protein n=1 Tax=Cladobotryum mycophilum TaxID=491253 RepID=A0ABR0SAR4_9HYPO